MTHIDIYPYTNKYANIQQEWSCIVGMLEIRVHTDIIVTEKEAQTALLEVLTQLQIVDSDVQLHLVWSDDF
jgi:hypothetical protein